VGEDVCNEFFSDFMNQTAEPAPIAISLIPDTKILAGERFRLTWQRGWGEASKDPFEISELQFVFFSP